MRRTSDIKVLDFFGLPQHDFLAANNLTENVIHHVVMSPHANIFRADAEHTWEDFFLIRKIVIMTDVQSSVPNTCPVQMR